MTTTAAPGAGPEGSPQPPAGEPATGSARMGHPAVGVFDQPGEDQPATGPQLLWLAGTIAAPTALLTALLFYFGRQHAFAYYRYFGVNFTVLDLSQEDYLVKSVDGLFVPLIVIAILGLVALAGLGLLQARMVARPDWKLAPFVALAILGAGLVLLAVAVVALLDPDALGRALGLPGLLLAVGALLAAYARKLLRAAVAQRRPYRAHRASPAWVTVAEWAGVFVIVSLGLFWSVGDYSYSVGTTRAQQTAAELSAEPAVVLYSTERLSLQVSGMQESACADPDAAYRFRYHGLKLVQQSGDHFFFLPAGWAPAGGVAIVMPRSDSLRLEFMSAAASAQAAQRPVC